MNPSPELQAALDAAEQAASIARSLFQHNIEVRIKADKSPVTEADVRCEIAIREILEARFPSYGFYGEETGSRDENAESLWLVDPIDGTKAFVREYPMFSTQIALMRRGEIVLGVSSAPVYGELSFAERGRGAYLNGKAVGVSQIATLVENSRDGRQVGAIWRARGAGQPHPGVWGFSALSFAGERQDRCRDRKRCEYSRYCGLRRDRQRSGRAFHGPRRCADHPAVHLGAGNQRADARPDIGGAELV